MQCRHLLLPASAARLEPNLSPLRVSAQSALQFYNQNKKEVLNILLPIAQETAEEVMTQIGNRILSSVPLSELLPA